MTATHSPLPLALAALTLSAILFAPASATAEPNEDFSEATVLPSGVTEVSDDIFGSLNPDTTLGAFDDSGLLIEVDDDSSPIGNGLASALFGIPVNPDGSIDLAVSGFPDFDFDGFDDGEPTFPHFEEGEYDLFIDIFDATGAPIDFIADFGDLTTGAVDTFLFSDPDWIGGFFDAVIDNAIFLEPGDVDFYRFSGLTPGLEFTAEITEGDFDTILALFDDVTGDFISDDDDSGDDLLSLLTGVVPASGEIVLAVSGFDDFGFEGLHSEFGAYTLVVTQVPEPASALLLIGLGAVCLGRRR